MLVVKYSYEDQYMGKNCSVESGSRSEGVCSKKSKADSETDDIEKAVNFYINFKKILKDGLLWNNSVKGDLLRIFCFYKENMKLSGTLHLSHMKSEDFKKLKWILQKSSSYSDIRISKDMFKEAIKEIRVYILKEMQKYSDNAKEFEEALLSDENSLNYLRKECEKELSNSLKKDYSKEEEDINEIKKRLARLKKAVKPNVYEKEYLERGACFNKYFSENCKKYKEKIENMKFKDVECLSKSLKINKS